MKRFNNGETGYEVERVETVLMILSLIPEELQAIEISSDKKSKIYSEINESLVSVFEFIESCLNANSPQCPKNDALSCLTAWIKFGPPIPTLPPLVNATLILLQEDYLLENCVEVLSELFVHPQIHNFELSLGPLVLNKFSTEPFRSKFYIEYEKGNIGYITEVCKLLASFGENFPKYISRNTASETVQSYLEMILRCTGYPGYFPVDEEISDLTFNFWNHLQEVFLGYLVFSDESEESKSMDQRPSRLGQTDVNASVDSLGISGSGNLSPSRSALSLSGSVDISPWIILKDRLNDLIENPSLKSSIINLYLKLSEILLSKISYPSEQTISEWNMEEFYRFKSYRKDCAELLILCYFLARDDLLDYLFGSFDYLINEWKSSLDSENQNQIINQIEAILFSIKSIYESIDYGEFNPIFRILDYIFDFIPVDSCSALARTAVSSIGTFAKAFNDSNSSLTFRALEYLIQIITQPRFSGTQLSDIAFNSLRQICKKCKHQLVGKVDWLVDIYLNDDGFEVQKMSRKNRQILIESISVISSVMNSESRLEPLKKVSSNLSLRLSMISNHLKSDPNAAENVKSVTYDAFSYVSALLSGMQADEDDSDNEVLSKHECEQPRFVFNLLENLELIMHTIWQQLVILSSHCLYDDKIISAICNIMELTLQTFKKPTCSHPVFKDTDVLPVNVRPDLALEICKEFGFLCINIVRIRSLPEAVDVCSELVSTFGNQVKFLRIKEQNNLEAINYIKQMEASLHDLLQKLLTLTFENLELELLGYESDLFHEAQIILQCGKLDCNAPFSESIFLFLEQQISKNFEEYLNADCTLELKAITHLLMVGLRVQERNCFKAVLSCWLSMISLISKSYDDNTLLSIISGNTNGFVDANSNLRLIALFIPLVIRNILIGILFYYSRHFANIASDVLFKFIYKFPRTSRYCIQLSLNQTELDLMPNYFRNFYITMHRKLNQSERLSLLNRMTTTRSLKKFKDILKDEALKLTS